MVHTMKTKVYLYMCKVCGNVRFSMVDTSIMGIDCGQCQKITTHVRVKLTVGPKELYFSSEGLGDKKEE